jgi:hypothetical protein
MNDRPGAECLVVVGLCVVLILAIVITLVTVTAFKKSVAEKDTEYITAMQKIGYICKIDRRKSSTSSGGELCEPEQKGRN